MSLSASSLVPSMTSIEGTTIDSCLFPTAHPSLSLPKIIGKDMTISEIKSLINALRSETQLDSISPESLGALLIKIIDFVESTASISPLSKIAPLSDTSLLPEYPNASEKATLYLIDGDLFIYSENKWQNVGNIRGPQGDKGDKGADGVVLDEQTLSLIENPDDLEGKTSEQKATMIPDGNFLDALLNGAITPIFKKTGYRIVYTDSIRGYYYATATQSVFIYDVTALQGKTVKFTRRRVANSYSWALVSDYEQIPSSNNLETWNSILISSSGQVSSADSTPTTTSIVVPEGHEHIYLCVSLLTSAGCTAYDNDGALLKQLENKQDALTFDNIPTEHSVNPVTSDGIYNAIKPVVGVTGILLPVFTKAGYRIVYSGSARGYYYAQSSASTVVFDVSALQGKKVSCKQTRQNNAYAYAFVTDHTLIPTSNNLDAWNEIYITGLRETTSAASTYITRTLTVPSGHDSVFLCVCQINSYPVEVIDLDAVVEPLTIAELQKLRTNNSAQNITTLPMKLGLPKITSVKYDYNVIIGYGQSLAAGGGIQAEDLPQDENALMFYLKYSSTNNYILTKNLETIKCTGSTSESQDFPPNASATVDFAKLYRLKTGDTQRKFVHICPAQGSMTIAQLMDFNRYKTVDTNEFYFPNLDTGYASVRPYYAFKRMLTRLKEIADAQGKTVGVIAVNWNQGEADYGNQTGTPATSTTDYNCNGSIEEYTARLRALHDDMWEDMQEILGQTEEPAWFIAQCSGQFVKTSFNINKALIDICDGKKYFETFSTYPVPNRDDGHPSGNGYRWYGEYLAKAMADVLLRNIYPDLMRVRKVVAHENSVEIYCFVPNPPMRVETNMLAEMSNYGFALRTTADAAIAIAGVKMDNDVIKITTASPLTIGQTVSVQYASYYSSGKNISSIRGAGNICDSDKYNANFNCMAEISSSVEYAPLNEDGNPLVGSPYPLYNFLQPFKIEVEVQE